MATPGYLNAYKSKALHKTIEETLKLLEHCTICPRQCKVNRLKNERGFCRTGRNAVVYSYFTHHGEEPPISGTKGSGTIFFSHCNMRCLYCQNHEFSQCDTGKETEAKELAACMTSLQQEGCHNINFVTPTHVMPQILEALKLAIEAGLHIPLIYNTSGYELPEIIKILDGIFDIYLADMRYSDDRLALQYSQAPDYPRYNEKSVREMFCQTGCAKFDKEGILTKGLIIRHLVLPANIAGSEKIFKFIAQELSPEVSISLMSQYHPCFEAPGHPPLDRCVSLEEYDSAIALMKKYGLENGWIQESGGLKRFAGTNIKKNL